MGLPVGVCHRGVRVPPVLLVLFLTALLGHTLPCASSQGTKGASDPLTIAPLEDSLRLLLQKGGQRAQAQRLLRGEPALHFFLLKGLTLQRHSVTQCNTI